ncbi:34346_t:CDS:2 [Gigaspora margarita]|uniref:34346_t:CDS:1 n=1 Tax=Gigaspora margarita TaxID=4874 RepID=A0ABN7US92_GIGMA|nr:34346_t:CDS:2 [Gigaspora margarita]
MASLAVPSSDLDINERTSNSEAETSAYTSLKSHKKRKNNLGKNIRKDRCKQKNLMLIAV